MSRYLVCIAVVLIILLIAGAGLTGGLAFVPAALFGLVP